MLKVKISGGLIAETLVEGSEIRAFKVIQGVPNGASIRACEWDPIAEALVLYFSHPTSPGPDIEDVDVVCGRCNPPGWDSV